MSEQTEINYLDGDIVWVKLGSCWWPGEVVGSEKLPPDVLPSFRKPPIAVVKFFQEDTYEYVKSLSSIFKYNCSRKNEFINKGLYMYRTKHGHMEKFPEDVIRAETAVGGDIKILTRDEFQETKKESYAGLFGEPSKKSPGSIKKGKSGRGRPPDSSKLSTPMRKFKEKTNYKVHILLQGSKTPVQTNENASTPSTSRAGSEPLEVTEKTEENKNEQTEKQQPVSTFNTPTMSSSGIYACHACQFTTTRLNVLILHNKSHSVTFSSYTPSPVRKKNTKQPNSTPLASKTHKQKKPRQEAKPEKVSKKSPSNKRAAESDSTPDVKKLKTDEEIKSSLLADWDDGDDDSTDESAMVTAGSPEVPIAAESPAVPTPAELPSAQVPVEVVLPIEKKSDDVSGSEKPESSSDSKYEFCEDEDWPIEADIGRKIPRVKNPSKRKGDTKSVSVDEDEMAREVAELLNKTTLPELPSAPEPLKVEENFPEPSIVKSPDKIQENLQEQNVHEKKNLNDPLPPKTIFKTKTFFRSRHSRSQDAIGKYVAEQLNAAERMDIIDNEMNGAEVISSPEIRISPSVDNVKVARLAPKIQLKKMKAEAAQLRELEKFNVDKSKDDLITTFNLTDFSENVTGNVTERNVEILNSENDTKSDVNCTSKHDENNDKDSINSDLDSINEIDKTEEKIIDHNTIEDLKKEINNDKKDTLLVTISESSNKKDIEPIIKFPDSNLQKPYEPFMNESTASAVDALLSVSREADRVTKVISDDPPEDLFEDDIKDNNISNNVNGYNEIDYKGDKIDEQHEELHKSSNIEDKNRRTENITIETQQEIVGKVSKNVQDEVDISEPSNSKSVEIEKNTTNEVKISELLSNHDCNLEVESNETSDTFPIENTPSESDLQVAEALINLPTTTLNKVPIKSHNEDGTLDTSLKDSPIHNKEELNLQKDDTVAIADISNSANIVVPPAVLIASNNENINSRFETEQEKCENLNAAQSLVQMSETIDHNIKIPDIDLPKKVSVKVNEDELKVSSLDVEQNNSTNDCKLDLVTARKTPELENNSSKLLRILEEPCLPKLTTAKKTITKQIIVPGKEKNLNFDVGKSPIKSKPESPKQKIIIRRTTPNKNLLNNITEVTTPDKIILSRSNKTTQDGSSVQTYTIQTTTDSQTVGDTNTIIIQPKIRKITKPVSKLQKIKPHQNSLVSENKTVQITKSKEEALFDINSMPIVISDDILTPENIEKMPIVMSDGNIITNSSNPPKLVKTKPTVVENEKHPISTVTPKAEIKTLLMNPNNEVTKVTTPNILSKSSKLRGAKPMLVIDKTTGKQKIIMTKSEPTIKEIKQPQTLIQPAPQNTPKTEKFIILPTPSSPRPSRTQKIVIDPQTGKAHVLVGKGPDTPTTIAENKPVSAKLVPSISGANTPGNTVMIITNAEGAQSRIVLTPEHEKILFPNKQPNLSQLKTFTHRITSNSGSVQKSLVSTGASTKTQTRIVPKQKSAIITSKGQLIVGGRIATTSQNIAPLPEIRPAPKRILSTEPKKLVQAIQKNSSEPLIFLKQKSGAVMQLTAAQFEHLQRTGQIIQKTPTPPQENKIIVQKSITISPTETVVPTLQKQRVRKQISESPTPSKKIKHEIAIAPAPISTMPALAPFSNTTAPPQVPNVSSTTNNASASTFSDLDNFEELLPSTAIARQESLLAQPELSAQPSPAPLSDGQLLAVPGEHFGGPTGSFYLCVEENGTFTVIDNRPLVLENSQLVPMAEPLPVIAPQPERRDILEAALANSDVFHAETTRDDAPDFRDLNANVSVHCRVSETSTTLHQPIMTPVEVPTKGDSEPTVPSNLEDGLAVIGVTPQTVPTSLELPITVTDPRIAPKTTDPLSNNNYGTSLLTSPNTEMTFTTTEDTDVHVVGPISMPLLTDEEAGGKSMPILTDDVADRTVSSVESTIGSPSSIDVRESENEDSGQWSRRLLTPCSDTSETSAEIPLQPNMQLSVSDLSENS
ncbi:uncharacterized protein LOC125067879 [Vanessa atalanta]|uniref:uncharacterized protein LOC125067879 n=1 Tax=Vanessa atalanta TaxID=42275 RepID=UPI001FCD2CF0|nr:uncharacterized protein LOC125067879 [Vanessa atalanta]